MVTRNYETLVLCVCVFIYFVSWLQCQIFFGGGEEWFGDKVDSYNGGIWTFPLEILGGASWATRLLAASMLDLNYNYYDEWYASDVLKKTK